eukprot:1096927-Pleurochrysis_carterae.AAC.1
MPDLLFASRIAASPPEYHILADPTCRPVVPLEDLVVGSREHPVADGELAEVGKGKMHVVAVD